MPKSIVEKLVDGFGLTHELVEWDGAWSIYDWPKSNPGEAVRIPERTFESEDAARQAWKDLAV